MSWERGAQIMARRRLRKLAARGLSPQSGDRNCQYKDKKPTDSVTHCESAQEAFPEQVGALQIGLIGTSEHFSKFRQSDTRKLALAVLCGGHAISQTVGETVICISASKLRFRSDENLNNRNRSAKMFWHSRVVSARAAQEVTGTK